MGKGFDFQPNDVCFCVEDRKKISEKANILMRN
jgi:hypothetical protein